MKHGVDAGIIVMFVLFPLFCADSTRPLVRYLVPDRFSILTAISMVAVSKLAHALKDAGIGGRGTISKNISEFRELLIYYIFIVYLIEVMFRRAFQPTEKPAAGEENPA